MFMDEDPLKPFRQALRSVGFSHEILFNSGSPPNPSLLSSAGRAPYFADVLESDEDSDMNPPAGFEDSRYFRQTEQ